MGQKEERNTEVGRDLSQEAEHQSPKTEKEEHTNTG